MNDNSMIEKPEVMKAYKRLAASIVLSAVRDYRRSFELYLKHGKDRRKLSLEAKKHLDYCPKFFASKWHESLSELDGKTLQKSIERRCYKELGIEIQE